MGNSHRQFARDTLIIGLADILVALSRIILLPLLTKTLGAHAYGIWAQAQVTIGLALGVVGLGLPYALTRFLPAQKRAEAIREEFWSVLSLVFLNTLVVSLILVVAARPLAEAFFAGSTEIVRIIGFIILTWSLDIALLSLFRAFRQMKRYALFIVLNAYVELAVIAFLVLDGHGILGVVWTVLAVRGVLLIPLFFLINSQVRFKRPHFSSMGKYLRFSLPTVPGNLASWVVNSSDKYIIGYYLGATSVGVYSAAYGLGSLMAMLVGVLGFVLPPTLSKLYDEGEMDEVEMYLTYSLKYFLAIAIPFVFGSVILAEPVLKLFSTEEIASQGYFVAPLIALSSLFLGVYTVIAHILVLTKKTRITGGVWLAVAAVNVGANVVVVPHLGILGAAVTTLIAYSLALLIGSCYSFREFKFGIAWSFIGKSLIASAVMAVAVYLLHPQSDSATVVAVLTGAATYSAVLILMKGFTRSEVSFFRRLLREWLMGSHRRDENG